MRDDVDEARHAARVAVDQPQRAAREELRCRRAAGDPQAMADVFRGLVAVERLEVPPYRDPLVQLRQIRTAEDGAQLRLADEHDLQELLGLGLEIREQAQLLEHHRRQVLRLVDDDDDARARDFLGEQEAVQLVDELLLASRRRRQPELAVDGLQQLEVGQGGVENVGDDRVGIELP